MKLVSLNTWGATQGAIFFDYIKSLEKDTDIFCFQEIFSAQTPAPKISSGADMYLLEELEKMLPEFKGFFAERSSGHDFSSKVTFPVLHGMAVFVKNNIKVLSCETRVVNEELSQDDPVEGVINIQVLNLSLEGKIFSIMNYHGPSIPGDKTDTKQRIAASEKIKIIWEGLPQGPKILCGDFNLNPDTQSIKILDNCGRDLIKEFKIENTRNEISWNRYNNKQLFADFAFVSAEVQVKSFQVPYNLVSDHLPMLLEFEI